MAYQLTSLGNEFPRFVVAPLEIHNLDRDSAADAVGGRIAALEDDFSELRTLKQVSTAPASHEVALDYLLASTHAQVRWLRGFVESLRTGRLRWRRAEELDTIEGSRNEVGI